MSLGHKQPFALAFFLLAACADEPEPSDAGEDAGADAGVEDTGRSDLGVLDALVAPDAGSSDSGEVDGGPGDAGLDPCRPFDPPFVEALEQARQRSLAEIGTPGLVIGVSVPCRQTWIGSAGEADINQGIEMAGDHLLGIGSITKSFVAAALLQLQEQGALALDDNLDQYVANIPNGDRITLRMLLNHSSGVFNYTEDFALLERINAGEFQGVHIDPRMLVATATASANYFEPGTDFHYSNTNYILAGLVIESVTASTADAQLRSRLLRPLGMDRAYLSGQETPRGRVARAYQATFLGLSDLTDFADGSLFWTAGAMSMDAADLLTWADGLFAGPILSPASQAEMLTTFAQTGYGLGIGVSSSPMGDVYYSHTGQVIGYSAVMIYFPQQQAAWAILANAAPVDGTSIFNRIFAAMEIYTP